eukprot:XP_011682198.1 PREDICTED: uncharacterized protein LOC105446720 [Strongylocentrotus purpuratus]
MQFAVHDTPSCLRREDEIREIDPQLKSQTSPMQKAPTLMKVVIMGDEERKLNLKLETMNQKPAQNLSPCLRSSGMARVLFRRSGRLGSRPYTINRGGGLSWTLILSSS